METLSATWNYPTSVHVGDGLSHSLPDYCKQWGMRAPLLVTDPGLAALPTTKTLIEACEQAGLNIAVFTEVKSNPNGSNVDSGVEHFRNGQHDGVIALGGGSALDAGKAIAFMAGQNRPLWDFEDIGDNWSRADRAGIRPVIAIPTTAGTGSEVGRSSVITDEQAQQKKIIFHPDMMPKQVLLDPQLSVGLPPSLTAATGMDALSHSLEAYCAPFYHPMADGIACEGMRLVKQHLLRAFHHGEDKHARTQMLVASAMGATAFQKGLGAMHALAHSLGALYDAHHGTLNAILMPYVLQANRHAIEPAIDRLANYLDIPGADFDGFMHWVLSLRRDLVIPHSLGDIGIDAQNSKKVGDMAVKDPCAAGNPVALSAREYEKAFCCAVEGDCSF